MFSVNSENLLKAWHDSIDIEEKHGQIIKRTDAKSGERLGYFPYVPIRHCNDFFNAFEAINFLLKLQISYSGYNPKKQDWIPLFMDVGAGTGRILYMAKQAGFRVKGVEYNPELVKIGKKYFGLTDEELICKDAFDLDREFYSEANIIYTYMPIQDSIKMGKLHVHLVLNSISYSSYDPIFVEMLPQYYPIRNLTSLISRIFVNYIHG